MIDVVKKGFFMIKKNNTILTLILATLFFYSCSGIGTYRDFKMSEVDKGEGVILAKVNINYNGYNYNENCSICFNSVNGPCQKLTKSGLVFLNLETGTGSVRRLACQDISMQYYNIEGAEFNVKRGINYVGNIIINWSNDGGFKATQGLGLLGVLLDEMNNDGSIVMNVSDKNKEKVLEQFSKQVGFTPKKISRNLASIGK